MIVGGMTQQADDDEGRKKPNWSGVLTVLRERRTMPNDTIVFANPQATPQLDGEFPGGEAFDFHQKLPGYRQSPLIDAPSIADVLGVGKVWVKDESSRFGLPAFKFLGASWAVYRVLVERSGGNIEPWQTFDDLKERFAPLKPLT